MRVRAWVIAAVGWAAAMAASVGAVGIRMASGAPPIENRFAFGDQTMAAFLVLVAAFATVGTLLAARLPRNPIGWLLLATGLAYGVQLIAGAILFSEIAARGRVEPPAAWAGWSVDLFGYLAAVALFGTFAVFPDGRVPLTLWNRWRWVVVAIVIGGLAIQLVRPGELWHFPSVDNPAGVLPVAWTGPASTSMAVMFGLLSVAPIAILVRRARDADPIVRQQIKWFALSAGISVIALAIAGGLGATTSGTLLLGETPLTVFVLSAALIPVSIGVAILRYRLYDIDVVIRRTLVYGAVVAILGVVYAALVLVLQSVLSGATGGETLPVALSTLAIAALFGPVRGRARDVVDRRFYRSRYDAQQTIEAFAIGLRDEVELEAVTRNLVAVATDTIRPASAGVWLRSRPS